MMNAIKVERIADGVYFNSVRDSRFKTMRITANLILPLCAETASENALLAGVLTRSCRAYPDFTALSRRLAYLYGADLSFAVHKIGDRQLISITVSGLDDRYALGDESVARELSLLLCCAIFEPNFDADGLFVASDVEQERRQLLDTIEAEFNDKRLYANARMISEMCSGECYGVRRFGTAEQVAAVTAEQLVEAWKRMLKTSQVQIMYIGDSSPDRVKEVFSDAFAKIERQPSEIVSTASYDVAGVMEFGDEMELSQSKLVMGFRTGISGDADEVNRARLMCAVLGGTVSSKLFLNVREKQSLCYYCASRYDRQKGIMVVDSGVENANLERTRDAILKEIEDMKNGVISDFELESAKLAVINSFRSSNDTVGGIESWYSSQLFDKNYLSIEQLSDSVDAVTKEEVVEAAKMLKLDTVYMLRGTGVSE